MTDKGKKKSGNLRKSSKGKAGVTSLLAAAAALPCVSKAESMPQSATFRFQYTQYEDWQEGDEERITVRAPMMWLNTPVAEKTELEMGLVYDAVSGASPLYHDTLSGASGTGIVDDRFGGNVNLTQHFEDFNIGVGATVSSEDDYDSQGGSLTSQFWSDDKNTTYTIGLHANHDRVRSTNNSTLDKLRRRFGGLFGITQVLDRTSLIQSNLSYTLDDKYLDDPYKLRDSRPDSRHKWAWLTRYRKFVSWAKAALHLDYRYYTDSWSIESHTIDAKWYQPLDEEETWVLRPSLRYYSQSQADFYNEEFPPDFDSEEDYTADQRLSGFGSVGTGVKLIKDFGEGYSASVSFDFIYESGGLKVVRPGTPGLDDIYIMFASFGVAKKF